MNKLLILLGLCLLASCTNPGTKKLDNVSTGIFGSVLIKEIKYKNHNYIEFKDEGTYGQGWVHDPDCECFENIYE